VASRDPKPRVNSQLLIPITRVLKAYNEGEEMSKSSYADAIFKSLKRMGEKDRRHCIRSYGKLSAVTHRHVHQRCDLRPHTRARQAIGMVGFPNISLLRWWYPGRIEAIDGREACQYGHCERVRHNHGRHCHASRKIIDEVLAEVVSWQPGPTSAMNAADEPSKSLARHTRRTT